MNVCDKCKRIVNPPRRLQPRGKKMLCDTCFYEVYSTPCWVVRQFVREVAPAISGKCLEPAVGDGAIVHTIDEMQGDGFCQWTTIDIRRTNAAQHVFDFTKPSAIDGHDNMVTNPPFSLGLAFAQRGLEVADDVYLLMRLNWLASHKRNEWLRANPPDAHVLPNRPSFTINGRTDMQEYAWFHWGTLAWGGQLQILESVPREERRLG